MSTVTMFLVEELAFTDVPRLPASAGPSGRSWRVWCRFCRKWHTHAPEPGHAWAHCTEAGSPYLLTGSVLYEEEDP